MPIRFFVDENDLALGKLLAQERSDVVYPGHPDLPEVVRGTLDDGRRQHQFSGGDPSDERCLVMVGAGPTRQRDEGNQISWDKLVAVTPAGCKIAQIPCI